MSIKWKMTGRQPCIHADCYCYYCYSDKIATIAVANDVCPVVFPNGLLANMMVLLVDIRQVIAVYRQGSLPCYGALYSSIVLHFRPGDLWVYTLDFSIFFRFTPFKFRHLLFPCPKNWGPTAKRVGPCVSACPRRGRPQPAPEGGEPAAVAARQRRRGAHAPIGCRGANAPRP